MFLSHTAVAGLITAVSAVVVMVTHKRAVDARSVCTMELVVPAQVGGTTLLLVLTPRTVGHAIAHLIQGDAGVAPLLEVRFTGEVRGGTGASSCAGKRAH